MNIESVQVIIGFLSNDGANEFEDIEIEDDLKEEVENIECKSKDKQQVYNLLMRS